MAPAWNREREVASMKLHTIMNWMRGVIQRDEPYDLPENVYNDIMPSGVHEFPRSKF